MSFIASCWSEHYAKILISSHLSVLLEADAMKLETRSKTFILLGEFGLDSVVRAPHNRQWADSAKPTLPLSLCF